jgi:hypothetical protein
MIINFDYNDYQKLGYQSGTRVGLNGRGSRESRNPGPQLFEWGYIHNLNRFKISQFLLHFNPLNAAQFTLFSRDVSVHLDINRPSIHVGFVFPSPYYGSRVFMWLLLLWRQNYPRQFS